MAYSNQLIKAYTYKFIDTPDVTAYTDKTLISLPFTCSGESYTGLQLQYTSDTSTVTAIAFYEEVNGYHFDAEVIWQKSFSVTDDQTTWNYVWQTDETTNYSSSATYIATDERDGQTVTITFSVTVNQTTGILSGDTVHNNSSDCVTNITQTYTTPVYSVGGGWKDEKYKTIVVTSDTTKANTFVLWFGNNTTATIKKGSYKWYDTLSILSPSVEQELNFTSFIASYSAIKIDVDGKVSYKNGSAYSTVYTVTTKWNTDTTHRQFIDIAEDVEVSTYFYLYFIQNANAYERVKLATPKLEYTTSQSGFVITYTNRSSYSAYAYVNNTSWGLLKAGEEISKSYDWEDDKNSYEFTASAMPTDFDLYTASDEVSVTVYKNWLNEPVLNAVDVSDDVTNITVKNTNDVSVSYYVNGVVQGSINAGKETTYSYTWSATQTSATIVVNFKDPSARYGDASTTIDLTHLVKLPAPKLTIISNTYDSYSFMFVNTSGIWSVQPFFDGSSQGDTLAPGETRTYTYSWNDGQTSRTINAYSMPIDITQFKQSDVRTITITRPTDDVYALDIEYEGAHYTFGGEGSMFILNPATTSTLGGIIVGDNLTIDSDGKLNAVVGTYTLPVATSNTLGGIKVGANLSITEDGVLSATDTTYTLPPATTSSLGGIIVGDNLTIDENGKLSAVASKYSLPIAGATTLGGVKIGENLIISQDGTLKAVQSTYTLPIATNTTLGGVKIGYTTSESTNKYAVQLDTNNMMFVYVSCVSLTTDQTISGIKTFTSEIKTNQIANENDNAMVRYKTTENRVVLGGSTIPTTIMGSTERPYYSADGSDFTGVPLALLSDCSGGGEVQEYATLVETLPEL